MLNDVTTLLFCTFHLNSKRCHWPMRDRQIHVVTRIISVSHREAKQSWIPVGPWITRQNQTPMHSWQKKEQDRSDDDDDDDNDDDDDDDNDIYTVWYRHVSKHVKKLKLYQQNLQPEAMPQSKSTGDHQRDREPWIDPFCLVDMRR